MSAQNIFICSAALCLALSPFPSSCRQQTAQRKRGTTSPWTRACCLLGASDCPRHVEYACESGCREKMDMNNKYALTIQGHSIHVPVIPTSLNDSQNKKWHQNESQHNLKNNGEAQTGIRVDVLITALTRDTVQ